MSFQKYFNPKLSRKTDNSRLVTHDVPMFFPVNSISNCSISNPSSSMALLHEFVLGKDCFSFLFDEGEVN